MLEYDSEFDLIFRPYNKLFLSFSLSISNIYNSHKFTPSLNVFCRTLFIFAVQVSSPNGLKYTTSKAPNNWLANECADWMWPFVLWLVWLIYNFIEANWVDEINEGWWDDLHNTHIERNGAHSLLKNNQNV